ncbi:MAG: ThuA domain-containing protein [Pirellulales bacterium]
MRSSLTLACLFLAAASAAAAEPTVKTKVLLVGKSPDHPYATHMYMHTCGMLAKCLERTAGVEAVVSEGWPNDPAVLDDVRSIVVYATPAAEFLLDGPQRNDVVAMMKDGVGLVTIHWASSVFEQNLERLGPLWMSYLGGTWVSNVGLYTGDSPLAQLAPDHPVSRGWQPFDLNDEYYLDPTLGEATPLLRVTTPEKTVIVGWAYERADGGRSFATTLGHFYRNFQQEPFRRLVTNGILWTAGVQVPEGGADVALSEADLALPPPPDAAPQRN